MAEPTSVLTFHDLILDVARELGYAYYGVNGDEAIQIPVDQHDLDECKRLVNKGIRMFVADAPKPNGWRWTRPVASLVLWSPVTVDENNKITWDSYDPVTDTSLIYVNTDSFFESMEEKDIVLTGVDTFVITEYVSAQAIRVTGDAEDAEFGVTWSIDADGSFTLPRSFSGMFTGKITFASDTDNYSQIEWVDEAVIRQWRETSTIETGDPYWAAIRVLNRGTPRRRWELVAFPEPDETMVVEFPFLLHFDSLVALTEVHPAPFSHDETIRAACLAAAERDSADAPGSNWEYYRTVCLSNSYRIDAQSAPRRLGYFGNSRFSRFSITAFREGYQRPNVTYNQ